jgi:hypothetical protein
VQPAQQDEQQQEPGAGTGENMGRASSLMMLWEVG